jgi:NAD(P)-dependent dehydrogenase (short-subunit alcohol dehydrogenase family)
MHGDPTVDLAAESPFDAVCWAHGANVADSLNDFDPSRHLQLYEANCLSILVSLAGLLKAGLLREGGARLVVISSIWQERARANKLSYIVTKAAVSGIVRSAAVDLGKDGHLINGILPGVLDTPMTAANLTASQIEGTRARTPSGKLPDLGTVADMALFLCSAQNQSITGQSVTVDQGMSNAILI